MDNQMKHVKYVPWMDKCEWEAVRKELFSGDVTLLQHALKRLSAWEARLGSSLPVSIVVTAELLHAYLKDITSTQLTNDSVVRMAYSAAVTRFTGLITEFQQRTRRREKLTFEQLGKQLGIPQDILDLRSEATHHDLPTLSSLRDANQTCIEWIKGRYWNNDPVNDQVSAVKSSTFIITDYMKYKYQILGKHDIEGCKLKFKSLIVDIQALTVPEFELLVTALVQDEHLVPSEQQMKKLKITKTDFFLEPLSLPKKLLKFWKEMLNVLGRKKYIRTSVDVLQTAISKHGTWQDEVLMAWLYQLITTSANCDKLNDRKVLEKSLVNPNKHTALFAKTLMSHLNITLAEDIQAELLELVDLATGEHRASKRTVDKIYDLDDLEKKFPLSFSNSTMQSEDQNESLLEDQHDDWSQHQIGYCPDVELTTDSLELPSCVDLLDNRPNKVRLLSDGDMMSKLLHTNFSLNTEDEIMKRKTPKKVAASDNENIASDDESESECIETADSTPPVNMTTIPTLVAL